MTFFEFLLSGDYSEALGRIRWEGKWGWYHDYADAIVQRDVRDVAQIEQLAIMRKLLAVLAQHFGLLVYYSGICCRVLTADAHQYRIL